MATSLLDFFTRRGLRRADAAACMSFDSAMRSIQGSQRTKNEDACCVSGNQEVFVVADGIGGFVNGELASRRAVEVFQEHLLRIASSEIDAAHIPQLLSEALIRANSEVTALRTMLGDPGTTVVAAVRRGRRLHVISAGDSRVYLVRRSRITQLTTDHTWAQILIRIGQITADEACTHRAQNTLLSYLGMQGFEPDLQPKPVQLQVGDRVLLCSDGLTESLEDQQLAEMLSSTSCSAASADALVQAARQNGACDDITCIVLSVNPPLPDAVY